MQKKISVIVPVFNCVDYVERCVCSILVQSYSAYEIILIDDGSTDDSGKRCDEISKKSDKIKTIHQINGGVSMARNTGIDIAVGEYLIFVDADDELPPNALEYLMSDITSQAELYIGSCLALGKSCEPNFMFASKKEYSKEELAYAIMCVSKTRLLMSGVWGKLFVTKIIKDNGIRFNTKLQNGEDGIFVVEYLKYANKIINMIDSPPIYYLYRYSKNERISAVSAFYPDFFDFHIMHTKKLYDIINEKDVKDYYRFYQSFIDELIIYLVRAYAYSEFFKGDSFVKKLNEIVNNHLVKKAIKSYKRENSGHSIMIPLAIRLRSIPLLYMSLRYRAKVYNKNNKKAIFLKSIYRTLDE